ncbi:ribose-5-phosphate isomerase [Candidatus Woesearchaeota archaeon]|nr:ribose-5-phosphate isomerase [Candidatus Woesearchaeota archaeon]|tara:strand:- start:8409 stop:8867 length:459 start_codon:yes stop_codon:yes gene_type:complete
MKKQKIILGSDHAGFELKEEIKQYLQNEGFEVEDTGAKSYDKADDYPDFIVPAAKKVAKDPDSRGIILGASGQGEAIAANKIKGIRAAVYYGSNMDIVTLSRAHNNANMLSLGAKFLKKEEAIEAVKLWLTTDFSKEERHKRRIKKISEAEK